MSRAASPRQQHRAPSTPLEFVSQDMSTDGTMVLPPESDSYLSYCPLPVTPGDHSTVGRLTERSLCGVTGQQNNAESQQSPRLSGVDDSEILARRAALDQLLWETTGPSYSPCRPVPTEQALRASIAALIGSAPLDKLSLQNVIDFLAQTYDPTSIFSQLPFIALAVDEELIKLVDPQSHIQEAIQKALIKAMEEVHIEGRPVVARVKPVQPSASPTTSVSEAEDDNDMDGSTRAAKRKRLSSPPVMSSSGPFDALTRNTRQQRAYQPPLNQEGQQELIPGSARAGANVKRGGSRREARGDSDSTGRESDDGDEDEQNYGDRKKTTRKSLKSQRQRAAASGSDSARKRARRNSDDARGDEGSSSAGGNAETLRTYKSGLRDDSMKSRSKKDSLLSPKTATLRGDAGKAAADSSPPSNHRKRGTRRQHRESSESERSNTMLRSQKESGGVRRDVSSRKGGSAHHHLEGGDAESPSEADNSDAANDEGASVAPAAVGVDITHRQREESEAGDEAKNGGDINIGEDEQQNSRVSSAVPHGQRRDKSRRRQSQELPESSPVLSKRKTSPDKKRVTQAKVKAAPPVKVLQIHPALIEFAGGKFDSIKEYADLIVQYCQDRQLQDPKEKRSFRTDDRLRALFKRPFIGRYPSKVVEDLKRHRLAYYCVGPPAFASLDGDEPDDLPAHQPYSQISEALKGEGEAAGKMSNDTRSADI